MKGGSVRNSVTRHFSLNVCFWRKRSFAGRALTMQNDRVLVGAFALKQPFPVASFWQDLFG